MKLKILSFIFSFITSYSFSQEILNYPVLETNETIQQISGDGLANIIGLQDLNFGLNNPSIILQMGNQNKLSVTQTSDIFEGKNNQTISFQIGNYNELILGQAGQGNLLLSFQMGYLAIENFRRIYELDGLNPTINATNDSFFGSGDGNKIDISQNGNDNGILAIQQGNNNFISAGQDGSNNYLMVFQRGNDNSVTNYRQENSSEGTIFDSITQEGENLSIMTDGLARITPGKNVYSQVGTNLSIEIHNGFLDSGGEVEVSQTGRDMNITVDQSYFLNPLR